MCRGTVISEGEIGLDSTEQRPYNQEPLNSGTLNLIHTQAANTHDAFSGYKWAIFCLITPCVCSCFYSIQKQPTERKRYG